MERHGRSNEIDESAPIYTVKGPNVLVRVMEEIEAIVDTVTSKKSQNPEMHANKDGNFLHEEDIDEGTRIYKVKGPNVFERAKEEIEAIMGTIHPEGESVNKSQQEKDGFWGFLAKSFAKCCYPFGGKRD